jgi:hypothetical protein
MADNEDTNNTCLQTLKNTFKSIDLNRGRLRCIGHILNLVAQALLLGEGVSAFQKELACASAENLFKVWHKKGRLASSIILLFISTGTTADAKILGAQFERLTRKTTPKNSYL